MSLLPCLEIDPPGSQPEFQNFSILLDAAPLNIAFLCLLILTRELHFPNRTVIEKSGKNRH
jgi:hypothetical protein